MVQSYTSSACIGLYTVSTTLRWHSSASERGWVLISIRTQEGVEVCVIQDYGILQLNMKTVTLVEGDASACDVISWRLHFPDYRQIGLFPQEFQRQCAQTLVTVDVKRSQIQEITTYA